MRGVGQSEHRHQVPLLSSRREAPRQIKGAETAVVARPLKLNLFSFIRFSHLVAVPEVNLSEGGQNVAL